MEAARNGTIHTRELLVGCCCLNVISEDGEGRLQRFLPLTISCHDSDGVKREHARGCRISLFVE